MKCVTCTASFQPVEVIRTRLDRRFCDLVAHALLNTGYVTHGPIIGIRRIHSTILGIYRCKHDNSRWRGWKIYVGELLVRFIVRQFEAF